MQMWSKTFYIQVWPEDTMWWKGEVNLSSLPPFCSSMLLFVSPYTEETGYKHLLWTLLPLQNYPMLFVFSAHKQK